MPKASSFSPLRAISPALMLVALILFFLPWIEVVRVPSKSEKEAASKAKKDAPKSQSFVAQSGLQIATADFSLVDPELKKRAEKDSDERGPTGKEKDELKAPVLFLYPLLLIAGIVLALVPIPTKVRIPLVAGAAGIALLVAMIFTSVALPIESQARKNFEKQKEALKKMQEAAGSKDRVEPEFNGRFPWQISFYLTILVLLGACGTSFLGAGAPAKGHKKGYDDFDDDEDDDDDDRPRKKKRRDDDDDDDEDDDDRPKKKKAMSLDDDEDDDRPKKKNRRDEDDDDTPPPKKKRRRDEDDEDDEPPPKKKPTAPMPDSFEPPPAPAPKPAAPSAPAGGNPFAFDDDAPAKKKPKRRDDDDEDDDRPRKKRRRDDDD